MDKTTIKEIQQYLRTLSFRDNRLIPVTVNGFYNKETENAVGIFQRFYGLPASGEVDSDTWDALVTETSTITKPITKAEIFLHKDNRVYPGAENELVSFLQVMINSLSRLYQNLSPVSVTGVYDDATENQIRLLQELHDLKNTGIVDVETWNTIATLFNTHVNSTSYTQTG